MDDGLAPDVVGEIIGWRAWAVVGLMRPTLLSLSRGTEWPHGGYLYADCASCADVPGEDCAEGGYPGFGCGIHATRDQPQLRGTGYNRREVIDQLWPAHRDATIVVGEVALSGKVIVGAKGWRATRARPVRLWLPFDRWRLVKPLAQAYGVPVQLANLRGEITI